MLRLLVKFKTLSMHRQRIKTIVPSSRTSYSTMRTHIHRIYRHTRLWTRKNTSQSTLIHRIFCRREDCLSATSLCFQMGTGQTPRQQAPLTSRNIVSQVPRYPSREATRTTSLLQVVEAAGFKYHMKAPQRDCLTKEVSTIGLYM